MGDHKITVNYILTIVETELFNLEIFQWAEMNSAKQIKLVVVLLVLYYYLHVPKIMQHLQSPQLHEPYLQYLL
jgi:hypothetical protein